MRKIYLFLFIFLSTTGYSQNSINNQDGLIRKILEIEVQNKYLQEKLARKDSIISIRIPLLREQIKTIDRVNEGKWDLLVWLTAIYSLLIFVIALISGFRSDKTARVTAKDEFNAAFKVYLEEIEDTAGKARAKLEEVEAEAELVKGIIKEVDENDIRKISNTLKK